MSPEFMAEWIRKAEADAVTAAVCLKLCRRLPDQAEIACFHSQQCVEKYLKALLTQAGRPVPRTHDLLTLIRMSRKIVSRLSLKRRDIHFLNQFAVEIRYPGACATAIEARQSVLAMKRVVRAVRAVLRRNQSKTRIAPP